jgi:hypothetical protein
MSLIPGEYAVNATKRPEYEIEVPITIEENKTISVNISLEFYPVTVTGITQSNVTSDPVGNITIRFTPDTTVDNNTAQFMTITSNENGYYSTKVMPGYYNISVDQLKNVSGINVSYTYTGTTHVQVGEGTKELNFILQVKEEE